MGILNSKMRQGKCWWILGRNESGETINCGKPTKYTMLQEPGMAAIRQYKGFCTEHQAIVDSQDNTDD